MSETAATNIQEALLLGKASTTTWTKYQIQVQHKTWTDHCATGALPFDKHRHPFEK